ncbi:hypothetical protein [Pontibacter chinhatensis]|uniref:Uncharacterized protein n=1 Tax=Pontibacter chinhatensis TaxID=1436961 RepID=A0A1I2YV39_9BACT|nr:hypothetical protein [Pontibacter chinhatensis]SFH29533.1 hypothetical protein SAMN05421739_11029 [Pontibacter chinhatensis]
MKTAIIFGFIALILPIAFIAIGYYLDYKHDKKGFLKDAKSILTGILALSASYFLFTVAEAGLTSLFPINSNYGKSYNDFRLARGIPVIESSWKVWPFAGNNFEEWWADTLNTDADIHTFKVIKYSLWGPVTEKDYFEKEETGFRLETIYNYSNGSLIYLKISPKSDSLIHFTGKTTPDPQAEKIRTISQEDFRSILNEWTAK